MQLKATLAALCLLAAPAAAWGQAYAEPADHSVIRQTGYGWRNEVVVPDGPCGCSLGVRADCYDQPCCFRCGLHPLCFLQRVHRMLDCLLPCKKCYCLGGCLLGGRCGGCCNSSCCGGCSSCSSGLPGFSDPFLDDPAPPKPIADPGTEVRYQPAPRGLRPVLNTAPPQLRSTPALHASPAPSAAPRGQTPWKVTTGPITRPVAAPRTDLRASQRPADGRVVIRAAAPLPKLSPPAEQSVLRRTSAEEPAPLPINLEPARPIVRSQSPDESAADDGIPYNPLRSR